MLLANVFGVNRLREVLEETEMMKVIEVPGLHGMKVEMGAVRVMKEVEIGCQSFKDMFGAGVYEEVGMS